MRNQILALFAVFTLAIVLSSCAKDWEDTTTGPTTNTNITVQAKISVGMTQNPDSLHNLDASTTVDSALINRLVSFFGGRSTGNIIWCRHTIIYSNGVVDSVGGLFNSNLWRNKTFTVVENVVYCFKVWGPNGPGDTSSAWINPFRLLLQFGGGTVGNFTELSLVNIGTMYNNGMLPWNLSLPKDRTQLNTSGAVIDISEAWKTYATTGSSSTAWFGTLNGYEGDKLFSYTGNFPNNWMAYTTGSIYRNPSPVNDTNRFNIGLRANGIYVGGTGPNLVLPGQTGDLNFLTGWLRWELIIGAANTPYDTVNFYCNNSVIPGIIDMLSAYPKVRYKVGNQASYTEQNQVMSPGKRWGKLTILVPKGSGSKEFRLQYDCNNIAPLGQTSSIAWYQPEFCFLVTITIP